MTQIEISRECIEATQQEVCERLAYTIEQLAVMMHEAGVLYLQEYFKAIPVMGRMMEKDKMFWNWWKNEWHLRNLVFLEDVEIAACRLSLQHRAYNAFNDPIALVDFIKPSRVVYCGVLPTLKRAS